MHDKVNLKLDTVLGTLYASTKYLMNDLKKNGNASNILIFLSSAIELGLNDTREKLFTKLNTLMIGENTDESEKNCSQLIQSNDLLQLSHNIISKHFVKNDNFNVKKELLFEKCIA